MCWIQNDFAMRKALFYQSTVQFYSLLPTFTQIYIYIYINRKSYACECQLIDAYKKEPEKPRDNQKTTVIIRLFSVIDSNNLHSEYRTFEVIKMMHKWGKWTEYFIFDKTIWKVWLKLSIAASESHFVQKYCDDVMMMTNSAHSIFHWAIGLLSFFPYRRWKDNRTEWMKITLTEITNSIFMLLQAI